jgi:cobalt-zinc-cadmium efflux system outer membrane protein
MTNRIFKKLNDLTALAVLTVAIITLPGNIHAQSVDSLIDEALRNNTQLKALKDKIKSAEYKSETVGYLPAPAIGLEFSQVPLTDPNPFSNALSQNLSISQMFMPGGKLTAMSAAEKKNVSIAGSEYDAFKLKLIADIKTKYYEIWMIEHHMELRDETRVLLKNLLQSAEQLYTTGKAKYSDVLMIKAELASNNTKTELFQDDLEAAVYEMNTLLGRDPGNTELAVQHNWEADSLKLSRDELFEKLSNKNPSLKKMKYMIEMNRLEITANNKELIPDIMVQGMVMRMPKGMIVTSQTPMEELGMGETEYMYSIMASITLPFMPWSAGKYANKEAELNASISGLSTEKSYMEKTMNSELNKFLEKLQSADRQLKLYKNEVIPLYRQTLDAQVIEFQNSRISINDVINTMQMLIMKEEEEAEYLMQHQMYIAEIEMMTGTNNDNVVSTAE